MISVTAWSGGAIAAACSSVQPRPRSTRGKMAFSSGREKIAGSTSSGASACTKQSLSSGRSRCYLERYGKPLGFYRDKARVLRVNNKQANGDNGLTQFWRVMNELNITGIYANDSSAKGRVEQIHLTLQDRLEEFRASLKR